MLRGLLHARGPSGLLALALSVPVAAQAPSAPGALVIEHEAPGCVTAGRYFRLAACVRPPDALARARVYFRAGGTADWFYVDMSGTPPCLEAVLPRPKRGLERLEYYVAATDRSFAETRTPVRAALVREDGPCEAGPVAPVVEKASVVIGSASGAAPEGFVTGGGLSPLLLVGGAALAAGVAALVVAGRGDGDGDDEPVGARPGAAAWRSELVLAGGRGQIVVDGAETLFATEGAETLAVRIGPGAHRFEATLVAGGGRAGTWRFDLSGLGLVPGSLRVTAGAVGPVGPDEVVFRLRGRPGERLVFSFALPEPR